MWIVTWRSSKTAILVQTAEDEIEDPFSWQCIWMAEEMQCGQAPVDAADAEMLGEVVFKLVVALLQASVSAHANTFIGPQLPYCIKALNVGDVLVHHQLQLIRKLAVSNAASSWSCHQRHVVFP